MPTIQCPSCQRRLQLPDDLPLSDARCPLCGTVFALVGPHAPLPRPDRPVGREALEGGMPGPPARTPLTIGSDLSTNLSMQYESVARWLKTTAIAGLIHALACGLCDCLDARPVPFFASRDTWGTVYFFWLMSRLVLLFMLFACAEQLAHKRNRRLARVTAILVSVYGLTLLLSGMSILLDMPELIELRGADHLFARSGVAMLLIGVALVAGLVAIVKIGELPASER